MKIWCDTIDGTLESERPTTNVEWHLVISGFWSEDMYHSGYVAYLLAQVGPGTWLLDSLSRNAELDGVTEEDVEEGRLNDDQIQAMWGMTLEETQAMEFRQIVAVCRGAPPDARPEDIAAALYVAVAEQHGKVVNEPDAITGLLDGG